MIVLDTNVLSELMKPTPNEEVVEWVGARSPAQLFTTSITEAEILHGVRLLPKGRRREAIEEAAQQMFREELAGRILSFDSGAADSYALIAVERQRLGRPIPQFDAQIAAIARHAGARVATRNTRDFEDCGVELINPWE